MSSDNDGVYAEKEALQKERNINEVTIAALRAEAVKQAKSIEQLNEELERLKSDFQILEKQNSKEKENFVNLFQIN